MSPRIDARRPLARPLILLVAALALAGCSTLGGGSKKKDEKNEGLPVETLYEKGHKSMRGNNYGSAEETFRRLIAQYPYGPYAEQALMETAYAQYKSGKNDDAVSTIDRFLRTYPTNRHVPYMYYLRGLANQARNTVFMQRVFKLDMASRDIAAPMQAYNDFGIVTERFGNSRYAGDARQRMVFLRNQFARYELNTSVYYLRRGAWVAAADRAKYLLEIYPQSEYQNDAVAVLAETYTRLGNETLAADAKRVLAQNDPTHPWLSGGWPKSPSVFTRLNPFAREQVPGARQKD
ncbi:outer membrane protein assembly factor BamD [Lysobacter pythonis]|uniref:Outer membrane protein assembly factor BamD n=1 Tax=Solilutibacter pythonis TaxID=2483112 RepID=A0A3M2I6V3_9GAMM|nr:outer membrane protein assembly factor BamD [Lysobacter pythonis]RMH94187.1 outer membrane protein assembly factor BamD [Lysobacter pythonis]